MYEIGIGTRILLIVVVIMIDFILLGLPILVRWEDDVVVVDGVIIVVVMVVVMFVGCVVC